MAKSYHRGRALAAALLLAGGCAAPARTRPDDAVADAAVVARSLREIDRYRAHLAAAVDEQRRKDEQIAALAAELRRVQSRCDALAAGVASVAEE